MFVYAMTIVRTMPCLNQIASQLRYVTSSALSQENQADRKDFLTIYSGCSNRCAPCHMTVGQRLDSVGNRGSFQLKLTLFLTRRRKNNCMST